MKSLRKLSAAAFLAICAGGVPSAAPALAAGSATAATPARQAAPAFTMKTLDGAQITSAQLAGKPYIVNFFASWCPPCREELPGMVELQKKYARQGFTFVGVAFRDRPATLPDFLWEMGVSYPVGLTTPELEAAFGKFLPGGKIRAIPASFVVGRDGKVLNVVTGGLTKEDFEALIVKAIATKPAK
ncbi:MAG: TlpA family protein disulfide reductase [Chlorobiaceae bacterium]|nr:TlpA family protein disulfide reductase [Chlorobiaceae bacterium]